MLQLAKPCDEGKFYEGKYYFYDVEPKLDGMRIAIEKTSTHTVAYSRTLREYTEHIPHIIDALPSLCHVDGELAFVAGSNAGVPQVDFNQTMRIMGGLAERAIAMQKMVGALQYLTFDDLSDPTRASRDRYKALEDRIAPGPVGPVHVVRRRFGNTWTPSIYEAMLRSGAEGIMLKNPYAEYKPGRRAASWYKLKRYETTDVVVLGFIEGMGKFFGMPGAVEFGQYRDHELVYRGQCSGFSDDQRRALSTEDIGRVMEIKHFGQTGRDKLGFRHPQFVRFRDDKPAEDCIWE